MTVKIGGKNYDSAALMEAVKGAKLTQTSKGGLAVILTFDKGTHNENMLRLTRNQLVKLVTTLEKKDKSRPLTDRIENLTFLSKRLSDFNREERRLGFNMSAEEKKTLKIHQKWGNLFFKRDKVLENTTQILKTERTKAVANINKALNKYAHKLLSNFTENLKHQDKSDVKHFKKQFDHEFNGKLINFVLTLPDSKFLSTSEVANLVVATVQGINAEE